MVNKPVAWMHKEATSWVSTFIHPETEPDEWMPLYTHPTKTLTDFEIKGVLALDECWIGEDSSMPNMIAFARAILKKAQE
jgi:hypothetical protein